MTYNDLLRELSGINEKLEAVDSEARRLAGKDDYNLQEIGGDANETESSGRLLNLSVHQFFSNPCQLIFEFFRREWPFPNFGANRRSSRQKGKASNS
jgi:hypothetical protein